jgi:hypothetical protein
MLSVLLYFGLALACVGGVSLLYPPRFLRIATRRRGAIALCCGLLLAGAAALWPSPLRRSARQAVRLDEYVPQYQFGEFHKRRVHASPDRIFAAIHAVTAGEIRLFRALTWVRNPRWPWQPTKESILAAPPGKPILNVATQSGFLILAEDPPHELVIGSYVVRPSTGAPPRAAEFAAVEMAGYAKAAMDFRVEDEGNGFCLLTTETRVLATDEDTRRRFALYWRLIYPGSALIRHSWLEAIARRAEG